MDREAQKASKRATLNAIYALCHPSTGEIRYIGKAASPGSRLKSHLRDAKRRTAPVYRWINKLARAGLAPVMRVLAWTDDWRTEERLLIAQHRAHGARLLNVADGGDEPACSREVRAANGRKVAAMRDKAIWQYRRNLGQCAAWCKRNSSNQALIDKITAAVSLFDSLSTEAQRRIATESLRRTGELA